MTANGRPMGSADGILRPGDLLAPAGERAALDDLRWPPRTLLALAAAVALHTALFGWAVSSRTAAVTAEPDQPVAVEVMDAAAFDKRYASLVAGSQAAQPVPQAAKPPAAKQPPQANEPPPPVQKAAASKPPAAPAPDPVPTTDPPSKDDIAAELDMPLTAPKPALDLTVNPALLAPRPKRALTAAELVAKQLGGSVKARAEAVDAYTRDVIRTLIASRPSWTGVTGKLIVGFAISLRGDIQDVEVVRSSGNAKLDNVILASLAAIRLPPPPPGAELRDRTMEVTYDYK